MTNLLGNKIYLIVGLIVIIGLAVLAFFLFPGLLKEKDTTDTSTDSTEKVEIYGKVHEIDAESGTFTIEDLGTKTFYKIKIGDNTKFSEIGTGNPSSFSNITIGQTVKIVVNKPKGSGGSGGSGGAGGGGSGGDPIDIEDPPDDVITYPTTPGIPEIGS